MLWLCYYGVAMKRTTIMLPQDLKTRAERQAREDGLSLGELVRRSLERSLAQPASVAEDPIFGDDATWAGEVPAGYAADHDDHLYGDGS